MLWRIHKMSGVYIDVSSKAKKIKKSILGYDKLKREKKIYEINNENYVDSIVPADNDKSNIICTS